jgi:hypothetical protein
MRGPEILVRTIGATRIPDQHGNEWQYHSRSDRHSKVACWVVVLDLLEHCALFREHARAGKVVFGINHEMRDFRTGRKKDLDLVICTPGTGSVKRGPTDFVSLADKYEIVLEEPEREALEALPVLKRGPVGAVHIALEAKACMTEHVKAIPRLHDELDSSQATIHGNSDQAIAGGLVMVNLSDEFRSPGRNNFDLAVHEAQVSSHRQPDVTERVIDKVRELRRRTRGGEEGFDALGLIVVECANDAGRVSLVRGAPAPEPGDILHYDAMIRRMGQLYETKFGEV